MNVWVDGLIGRMGGWGYSSWWVLMGQWIGVVIGQWMGGIIGECTDGFGVRIGGVMGEGCVV